MIEAVTEADSLHLPLRFTEAQLLAEITPETAHADEVARVYESEIGDE